MEKKHYSIGWLWRSLLKRKVMLFSIISLIITLPIFLLVMKYQSKVEAAWYDSSWLYRKQLVLNNSAQAENLTNFPTLVVLTSSNFDFTQAQSAGQDIRFTDSDQTTALSYEIESYDSVGQTARIWVKVPQIDASSSTDSIYMYWGNSVANDAQDTDNTWNSNYKGVYHLSDNAASTTVTDSSGNANNLTSSENTNNGFYQSDGKIGGAVLTAGTPTYITNQSGSNITEQFPDIVLDSNGYPVIAYYDATNLDLILVHCNDKECKGNNETVNTVDSTNSTGYYPSLQLDSNGYPMIAYYYGSGGDLKYVHCNDVNCSGGDETFSVIETTNTTGQYPRMVLDGSRYPVIAYYYGTGLDLKIVHCGNANCNSGNIINTVDSGGTVGANFHGTDLVLDASGYPVMSYYDTTNTELKVAHCNDVNCSGDDEAINSPLSSLSKSLGQYTALELDATGLPMIAYYNTTDYQMEFIHCDDANCAGDETASRVTVSAAADYTNYPSMEKTSSGNPFIVASRNVYLSAYNCANTNCSSNTRTDLALYNQYGAYYPNFKLDANNNVYAAAYSVGKTGDYDTLLFTTHHKLQQAYDSDFDFGTGSFSVSAWFKTNGQIQKNYLLSRYDADQGFKLGLNYAGQACFDIDDDASWGPDDSSCSSNSQIVTNVDNGNSGNTTWQSMVLDSNYYPVIAYFDSSALDLEIIHCNDVNCTGNNEAFASIDQIGDVGRTPSIILDGSGYPVVAYHDNTNNDLKIVHCGNANCSSGNTINTVDNSTDDVGDYPTIKLDSPTGYPVISYYDTTNTAVKLVHCNDVNCSGGDESIVTLVNDEDDRVRHGSESLQLDGSGYPMVVYTDITNYDLKYIHCNDVNCAGSNETKTTIETANSVGDFASMTLDSNGYPVIVHYDGSYFNLRLVHCGNTDCSAGNVASAINSTNNSSAGYYGLNIKLNASGNPVILSTQLASWSTILTACNDPNCSGGDETNSIIRESTYSYQFHSLALDSNSYPVIAYSANGTDLRLIHMTNGTTYTETGNYDDGNWHHLVAVKNGTSSITTYVDGVSVGSDTSLAATGTLTSNSATFNLAEEITNTFSVNNWSGYIDEVQIDNTARSAAWVAAQYLSESNNFINTGITQNGPTANSLGTFTNNTGAIKNNLVGHWKFDEGHDVTANNSGSGGSAFNGILGATTTAPTWSNNGKFGKALSFDGNDDVVSTSLDLANSQPWTYTFWIQPTSLTAGEIINGGMHNPRILIGSSKIQVDYFNTALTYKNAIFGSTLTANRWYYVAVVYDGSTIKIFYNGNKDSEAALTDGMREYAGYVGFGYKWGVPFVGLLDEVKVYSAALTAAEVKMDYDRGGAMVLGALSDTSNLTGGSVASNSASAAYCIPGDASTCSAPVGEWNFEEKTGTTANDISGNSNTMSLYNTPTWSTGKFGSGITLNGSNQYLDNTSLDNSSFPQTAGTISFWAKGNFSGQTNKSLFDDWGAGRHIFARTAPAGLPTYNIQIIAQNADNSYIARGYLLANDNQWNHFEITYDTTTDKFYVYHNGILKSVSGSGQDTMSDATWVPDGQNVVISSPSYFSGSIDQVRIYDYARTPAQIAWDYNRGGPIGWWKMDECQGGTLYDSSGKGNNMNITIGTGAGGTQTGIGTCTDGVNTNARYNGRTGKYNASLNFDSYDDVATVTSPAGGILNPANIVSVSAWVWINGSKNNNYIATKGWGDNYEILLNSSNQAIFRIVNTPSTDQQLVTSTISLASGQWQHVTGTYDGQNIKIYINGKYNNSQAYTKTIYQGAQKFAIGGIPHMETAYFGNGFNGQIDDVRVYNYALTPQQVKQIMNEGASIRFAPLQGSP